MNVHVINSVDNSARDYLIGKFKIDTQLLPNVVVELRKLDFDDASNLLKILDSSSLRYYRELKETLTDILIIEEPKTVLNRIKVNEFERFKIVQQVIQSISNYLTDNIKSYKIGEKIFDFRKAYLMGILNITPDSFSDGGKYLNSDTAVDFGLKMIDDGADIIDIGGESTRPGSDFISVEEEKNRVLPVIEKLLKVKSDLIISIDTTKSQIASTALDLGVKIVNDVSGMTLDENMISVCSKKDASVILMHMKGIPKTMQDNPKYNEIISDIYDHLQERIELAISNGIEKIIIDPGIGFGKSVEDNFTIIRRLKDFSTLGYPILIGLSRKTFIGKTLNLEVNERDFPTAILETISLMNSARIIRTHNIKNGRLIVDLINKVI